MSDTNSKELENLKQISHLGHFWIQHAQSKCYNSPDCLIKSSNLYRCSACHSALHITCISRFSKGCKHNLVHDTETKNSGYFHKHYWIPKLKSSGRCFKCDKVMKVSTKCSALICAWCKRMLHDIPSCLTEAEKSEFCDFGLMKNFIISPDIVSKYKNAENRRLAGDETEVVDPKLMAEAGYIFPLKPILVFVNPKSGGNLGEKLLQEFRWFLNPDQVFDVFQDKMGVVLSRFANIPNLHILVCGGDGSVSYLYSLLDQMKLFDPDPILAVMPLGTGNDLARAMKWGGEYNHSNPIPFLTQLDGARLTMLDRWSLSSDPLEAKSSKDSLGGDSHDQSRKESSTLPAVSFTNYFSCGLDADIAMNFHCNRAAFPEMYSNRTLNKMHYGRIGLISMLKKSTKSLCDCLTSFKVDGVEQISKVIEHKPKCILLININSYSAGTSPWGKETSKDFKKQKMDDGLLEVVFLNSKQMIMLHIGGAAIRLAQCKSVQFVTSEVLPMQVDGEPCMLSPSVINVSFLKQSPVLKKSPSSIYISPGTSSKSSKTLLKSSNDNIILSSSQAVCRPRPTSSDPDALRLGDMPEGDHMNISLALSIPVDRSPSPISLKGDSNSHSTSENQTISQGRMRSKYTDKPKKMIPRSISCNNELSHSPSGTPESVDFDIEFENDSYEDCAFQQTPCENDLSDDDSYPSQRSTKE